MLPDLHTGFSRGRSGGLVFPSLHGGGGGGGGGGGRSWEREQREGQAEASLKRRQEHASFMTVLSLVDFIPLETETFNDEL